MPTTTFTYTAQKGARLAHAVGVALGLKDGNGIQRDATKAESEDWLWGRAKQIVIDIEGREGEIARGPVAVAEMDLT